VTPRLSVIVVNYGSSALLEENLTATLAGLREASAVVVDNFTTAAERDRVRELSAAHGWTALLEDENHGFGGGVNRGVQAALAAGASHVLVLNPDARIDADSVAALMTAAQGHPTIAAPHIDRPDGSAWFRGSVLDLADGTVRKAGPGELTPTAQRMPWLTGACLLITRDAWEATGGFDEDYFLYWEDVDLSRRALDAGVRLVLVPEARAIHDAGGTQETAGTRAKSKVYYYFNARNRLLYAGAHLDPPTVRAWIRATPRVSWGILMRGGRRQLLTAPGGLLAVIRGSLEGIRDARSTSAERARVYSAEK